MRNTSPLLPWSARAQHLSQFSQRLKISGYQQNVRAKVISEGVRAQLKLEARQRETGAPANRPKGSVSEQEERRLKKKSRPWFSKNQAPQDLRYTTTLFIPPTPGSTLLKELQRVERSNSQGRDWGVKFVEKRGTTLDQLLSKSYPWTTPTCQDVRCFPCSSAPPGRPPKISCRTPGVGYRITCLLCKEAGRDSAYEGETGRNGHTRGREHLRDLTTGSRASPLVSHHTLHHSGTQPRFQMAILRTFREPLERQLEEASRIKGTGHNPLTMNSRAEWRSTPLPQLGFSQGRVQPGTTPAFNS